MSEYTIVLQAGGKSSRMGADKALLPFLGTTMLGYILGQVKQLTEDIIIISNSVAEFEQFGVPVYSDIYPDWGALGGLHTAITYASREWCMVLACDMPFVELKLLSHLNSIKSGYDVVIPRLTEGKLAEPFRAMYSKNCLKAVEKAIKSKKRRAISFFDEVQVRYVDQPEIQNFDPALRSFFNVNTPAELAQAVQMALTAA